MSIHIFKLISVPVISVLIIISTVVLNTPENLFLMITTALLLFLSVSLDRKYPWLKRIQFIFVGAFHLTSQLNWCVLLYYILTINMIENKKGFRDTVPVALFFIFQYSLIRFTYLTSISSYAILASIFDIITSVVIVLMFQVIIQIESERRELTKQNDYLTNHDPLTGLYNYVGYMNKVQHIIHTNREFLFLLFDINNFKSLNAKDISTANEILVNFSHTLLKRFPNHLAASRYVGDRFALLLPPIKINAERLNFEELGIQVTYSMTRYPEDANTFQQLIHVGEEQIFQMRREYWLTQQEEQSRSDKLKMVGELAAGMAHEIRNPLTSIQGFIQLSKNSGYNIQPWYEVIMREITRVGELTAEFLQFSKPHASNMKIERIESVMGRVYSLCESEATSRGHTIEMEILDQNMMLLMDCDKIIQVLINLIRNAFQAMEHTGQVYFSLSREGDMAAIQVRDNGKGIQPNNIDRIFDPFYTTKEDGTGLGLSLCQKIIEDHNGYIKVKSEVGSGSVFTVKLPLSQSDPIQTMEVMN